MTREELFERIGLQEELRTGVRAFEEACDWRAFAGEEKLLCAPGAWQEGLCTLEKRLGEDPDGIKILACMLRCCLQTWETYQEKGISGEIFTDTMKCFTRFSGECLQARGRLGFDRAFWTPRQLSMTLFRLGELEYEMTGTAEERILGIHIPSDARLIPEALEASFQEAEAFFRTYYPEYAGARIQCCSWLLSPALERLLPADSRILTFQKYFQVTECYEDETSYLEWVYQIKDRVCPTEELPERTSLQRRMKAWLLEGGKVGEALGVLKKGRNL